MRPVGSHVERVTINGVTRSVHGWSEHAGITWRRMRDLRAAGHTVEEIVAMEHPPIVRRSARGGVRVRTVEAAERRIARLVQDCERALARLRAALADAARIEARISAGERREAA